MLSILLTPAAIDKSIINHIINNLHTKHINDVVLDLLKPYADLIDWNSIEINHKTIILFSKLRFSKASSIKDERWLESDEWLDMCNDMCMYDN